MNFVDRLMILIQVNHKQATAGIQQVEKTVAKAEKTTRRWNSAMLGFGLSMLFTGMAVKRLGESILTSLVKTYMQATDEQSKFNQQLMAVQASFEFLKFSIMDALGNNEMVINFIEGLINMVNWISQFVNTHPQLALILGVFSVMAIVLGGIAMVLGQITLFAVGLGTSFAVLAGAIALIAAIGALLVSVLVTDMSKANPILTAIKIALIAIGLILLTMIAPVAGLVMLLIIVGVIIAKLWADFGSFGNFFKGVIRGLIMAIGFLGQWLIEGILFPLQLIAVGLIRLIELTNRFTGSNISTAALEKFVAYKPDIIGGAATLADKIKLDETKGNLVQDNSISINIEGDVTDANLIDKIYAAIDAKMEEIRNRYTGITQGA